ncbi:MAG: lipoyl synthase [Clostridiales bacterium]
MERKPKWLKASPLTVSKGMKVNKILKDLNLNTVCNEANCPNIGECFSRKTATFMILGRICSRNCKFCNVINGNLEKIDPVEHINILEAVKKLNLKHVVITSVTRDDLIDGGAGQFSLVIKFLKNNIKNITIEVLIPDFQGKVDCLRKVILASPQIIGHNIETVPRLYDLVRSESEYKRSIEVIKGIKTYGKNILSKSGIMLGLGENEDELIRVMEDLRYVSCDILTIGQYLQPTKKHFPVKEYVKPEVFDKYKEYGIKLGFKHIESGPLVRSSYYADKIFE